MGYMKGLFAALLVCVAAQAQAQSWSAFGTGKWNKGAAGTEVTTTSDETGTYGGVSLAGGPTTLTQISSLSFSYTPDTNMNSGGSPRLTIMFSDEGRAELRPLTLTAKTMGTLNGLTGSDWDVYGGTCGPFLYAHTWENVVACHSGATITEIFIVNDSGWMLPGLEKVVINAATVNGIAFRPSANDCKHSGYVDLGFANQGQCVSSLIQ